MTIRAIVGAALSALVAAVPGSAAGKPPASCGSDVVVTTVVRGTEASPELYKFVSDGAGPDAAGESYPSGGKGQSKIDGRFQVDNCSFDFTVNVISSPRYFSALLDGAPPVTADFVNFDRVASVPLTVPGPGNPEFDAFCASGVFFTSDGRVGRNSLMRIQDNYGGCHQDAESNWYVRRAGHVDLADSGLFFNRSPLDLWSSTACDANPEVCQASFVRVYHPTANTWILRQEDGGAGATRVKSGAATMEPVPFEIVVTQP